MTNKCLKSRILDKLRMLMNSNVKILDKRITLIKFQGCSSARMSRERPVEFLIYTCL